MSTSTTYTVHVQEFPDDLTVLTTNKYRLQVAKSVSTDSALPEYNVVYASHILAPDMTISWTEDYGLNWVQDMSKPGVNVTYGGQWIGGKLGDCFKLDSRGVYIKDNSSTGEKDALNVVSNDYAVPVHVIVGVKDPSKADPSNPEGWTPIYVSPKQILVKGNGHYTPKQGIQIWYETNDNTAKMISGHQSFKKDFDMTKTPEWWFHWEDASGIPDTTTLSNGNVNVNGTADLLTTTNGDSMFNPIYIVRIIRFSPPIEKATRAFLIAKTIERLAGAFGNAPKITFEGSDGKAMKVEWPKKADSPLMEMWAVYNDGANVDAAAGGGQGDAVIDAVLRALQQAGGLPADETWSIEDVAN
ncbi:hypothetical protein Slin15195_G065670 [Septoria linicola]|uniref:Uncharacterized protein n=1 Tax=Septoria linicola TaxID=215465 RepID=A0A9Q9AW88_9PEZI|nr:hypothetical protein Slin14017_G116010 [Septoria linicola]USW53248.1 hypothetical protein Slin15195_G065670 [Septoria linicola]